MDWGGTLNGMMARGFWTPNLQQKLINYRELTAVFLLMLAFQEQIKGKTVLIWTDNITTAAYLNKITGSTDSLYLVGWAIHNLASQLGWKIITQYIKGKNNVIADKLSRWQDKNNWMLHPELFKTLELKWEPYSIDQMTSFTNYQIRGTTTFTTTQEWKQSIHISNLGTTRTITSIHHSTRSNPS